MDWSKFFYAFIIALVYVPMVFMGSNVFFPKFTAMDDVYRLETQCHQKYRFTPEMMDEESSKMQAELDACLSEYKVQRQQFEEEKRVYESGKYIYITAFNLIVLLIAVFVTALAEPVMMGLFLGSVVTTFFATVRYLETNSRLGFAVLVMLFILTLFFINRRKGKFLTKNKK